MADILNPYAPPSASLIPGGSGDGCWRRGTTLITLRESPLPPRCVKCNGPAEIPTKPRKLYWHNPAIYLLFLVSPLIYIIVALIVRKQATIEPGLCPTHRQRRTIGITTALLSPFAGIGLMVFSNGEPLLILLGVLVFLGGLIAGVIMARIVYPTKIDAEYVVVKGCGEAFLNSLPDFHG